jgi:hypothetical protein
MGHKETIFLSKPGLATIQRAVFLCVSTKDKSALDSLSVSK